jgi:hypothetical protein
LRGARLVARWGVAPVRLAAQVEVAKTQPGLSGGRASAARRPAAQPSSTIPLGLSCGPAAVAPWTRPRRHDDWRGFRNPGEGDPGNSGVDPLDACLMPVANRGRCRAREGA